MNDILANAAGILVCVITLAFIYCMLLARTATTGTQRRASFVVARSPLLRSALITPAARTAAGSPTTVLRRPFGASSRILTMPNLLQGAVTTFEQKQKASISSLPTGPSSSPPVRTFSSQSVSRGFKNPFKPTTPSVLNGLSGSQQQAQRAAGIKRTASGLTKTFNSSFGDRLGSQGRPIRLDGNSPAKSSVVQVTANEFVDENDFDSDIDLDIEEPKAKNSANYPQLPVQPAANSPIYPILYPTLPRQQQVQTTRVPDYQPNGIAGGLATPKSSAPIPWSSSPPEHLRPAASIASNVLSGGTSQPGLAAAPPKKRRTIPWLTDAERDGTAQANNFPVAGTAADQNVSASARPRVTGTPKDTKVPQMWNTSASAVKEQQKLHRDQFKRPVPAIKVNQGDDEAIQKAKSSRSRPAKVFLSEEQQHVLNLVVEKKKSVFFTGSAGTGKSVLMREIINTLRRRYQKEPDRIAVTASTGLAACNVGGVTLHSFAGIGLGKEPAADLVRKIKKNQKARQRWLRTKVLVVDEVSMVDGDLFDKLESVARSIRNNGRPFGGIQLVITGDFFQLPPVPERGQVAKFAFDAATWATTVEHTIGLHHVFRQKDPVFASMLNEMREGRMSQASISAFQKLTRPLKFEDQLECTELYPRREDVERANAERLHSLQGQPYIFDARDGGAITDMKQRTKLLSNCLAPESITLKKGAQVMLIKNIDEGLVNGSIGQVMGLMDEQQFDRYTTDEDEGIQRGSGEDGIKKPLEHVSTTRRWPVVRFLLADGTTRDLLCQPENWKVELPNGEVQASRLQVPLILAWALSIHKAQGQTLDRVKVDLGKVFEKGQAYVALSRATSMAGLQVLRFDPKKVLAHDRVRHFYANLSRIELNAKHPTIVKATNTGMINFPSAELEQLISEETWAEDF